jgi:spore coat polysaccharide biosynthesis predicted glycosyltransferase SpsG
VRHALFDARGSRTQGLGHVVRSLALADRLAAVGFRVTFLPPGSPRARAQVQRRGYPVRSLRALPARLSPTVLVVDRPDVSAVVLRAHRRRWPAVRIVALDYYGASRAGTDAIVNLNEARVRISAAAPGRYVGLQYAILRDSFRRRRARPQSPRERCRRLAIAFGATDPYNWTPQAIRVLQWFVSEGMKVEALTPQAVRPVAAGVRIHAQLPDPARLLSSCDAAMIGGGTLMMECACLGVPAIVVPRTPAERQFARRFVEGGAVILVNSGRQLPSQALAEAVRAVAPKTRRRRMALAGRRLVDGRGAERIVRLIAGLTRERGNA